MSRIYKVILLLLLALSMVAGPALAQIVYDGIILGRASRWDGYPSHLYFSGKHYIWWCSQGNNADVIYRSTKTGSLGPGGWSTFAQVFSEAQSPWATHHTCDPSVIRGTFSYNGVAYSYAMYYTSDTNASGVGGNNSIGVAFSKDGVSWTSYPNAIILPGGTGTGYGAGMSGVAFNKTTGKLMHAYLDSSVNPLLRLSESGNGINFTPLPGTATQLHAAGRLGNDGQGPDISYNTADRHWYAAIKNHDPQGIYDGETRVLRAINADDLLGSWQVIGIFNSGVTGWTQNHNPGLGKNSDGTLYLDSQGWAYVFFTVGNPRPDVGSWEVAQGRFRVGASPSQVVIDVNATVPGYLTVTSTGGEVTAGFSPSSAVVSVPGGTAANSDNLWNVQNDLSSKPGFNAFIGAAPENPPLVTIEVRGLKPGLTYDVYGRFGTAVLQSPPNYYGIEMGINPGVMSRFDQTTSGSTLVSDWSNWQEREVLVGTVAIVDGIARLYVDENSVNQTATWTGLRLVKR